MFTVNGVKIERDGDCDYAFSRGAEFLGIWCRKGNFVQRCADKVTIPAVYSLSVAMKLMAMKDES